MKALITKELREQRWLWLACLVTVVLGYARSLYDLNPSQAWLHVFRRSFYMVTTIAGAGFMLALGFRQTFEEVRRGSWEFLIHRPVSPARIFYAKVVSAVLMFVGALVVPTGLVVAWCAAPGRVAGPFSWVMVGPVAADLLGALPYLFAGMVMGLWQARFKATRGAVLAAPVINTLVAHGVAQLYVAVLVTVALTVIYGWLARAIFLRHAPRATSVRSGLAATLAVAAGALHLLLVAAAPRPSVEGEGWEQPPARDAWFVSRDGTLQRAVVRRARVQAIFDDHGAPVPSDLDGTAWLHDIEAPGSSISASRGRDRFAPETDTYRTSVRFRRLAHEGDAYRFEWYADRSSGRLLAFDARTRRWAGTMGPDGWSPDGTGAGFSSSPLADANMTEPWWLTADGLFLVDWETPSIERVDLVGEPPYLDHALLFGDDGVNYHLVRSATHVDVFVGATPRVALPIDEQARHRTVVVGRIESNDAFFVEYDDEVAFFDASGRLLRRQKIPSANSQAVAEPVLWPKTKTALYLPPAAVWFLTAQDAAKPAELRRWRAWDSLLAVVVGLLAAFATLFLGRGHARGLRLFMALLAAAVGPFAVVLPRLLPTMRGVRCTHCGARREATSAPCPHCGKTLRGYEQDETAIVDLGLVPETMTG